MKQSEIAAKAVAPARERGLKSQQGGVVRLSLCRSREGAWIEIAIGDAQLALYAVAPARERGLK